MLALKRRLVGSGGWHGDNVGCSVEARIERCEAKAEDSIRRQLDYGKGLIWVYDQRNRYSHELVFAQFHHPRLLVGIQTYPIASNSSVMPTVS